MNWGVKYWPQVFGLLLCPVHCFTWTQHVILQLHQALQCVNRAVTVVWPFHSSFCGTWLLVNWLVKYNNSIGFICLGCCYVLRAAPPDKWWCTKQDLSVAQTAEPSNKYVCCILSEEHWGFLSELQTVISSIASALICQRLTLYRFHCKLNSGRWQMCNDWTVACICIYMEVPYRAPYCCISILIHWRSATKSYCRWVLLFRNCADFTCQCLESALSCATSTGTITLCGVNRTSHLHYSWRLLHPLSSCVDCCPVIQHFVM